MFHKYLKYKNKYLNIGGDKKEYLNSGVYNGELMNGKRNGKGTMTYSTGAIYTGTWKNDKKNGEGEIIYKKDGSTYKGTWKDDKDMVKEE